jgi:hypothetical protein
MLYQKSFEYNSTRTTVHPQIPPEEGRDTIPVFVISRPRAASDLREVKSRMIVGFQGYRLLSNSLKVA